MVIRERFSLQGIRDVLGSLLEQDLHAKRVNSLCDATLGVLCSNFLQYRQEIRRYSNGEGNLSSLAP